MGFMWINTDNVGSRSIKFMQDETPKQNQTHDTAIALMAKDISYIRESQQKMELTLATMDKDFARKSEIKDLEKTIVTLNENIQKELNLKVNNSDFDPIKTTLGRINWMIIAAIVAALLAFVVKAGS